ncbi:MAG TPA: NAD(P)/FAD-dependent oxidoreductase [Steroidobacteraceae bacterium]|jgi:L-2-hydroxyglutarate oxidase LhgO|nr:NAD(P)/FAD-dependent oxidoreductase [Steroidobacteraceae bacterium]
MTEAIDCVVIGAGVVGLAVARAMALRGRETLILEAESAIGTETSSRNSEVIHAGIYYPPGSAKARLCVEGKRLLYEFCDARGVEYRRCGKLIVAADESQIPALEAIENMARANGVNDLTWLTADEAHVLEPELDAVAALSSPSTGIIDSHGFMLALQGEFEQAGGMIAFRSRLQRGRCDGNAIYLEAGAKEPMRLAASVVVNCAGLHAQKVSHLIDGVPKASIPRACLAKGSYYVLQAKCPFRRLVYPVPEPGGLGVHLTLDLAGQARFGPDVEWVEREDYTVDPARAERFYAAIRRYWPALPNGSLQPGYAGIRPKLHGPGGPPTDFLIQGPDEHGVKGLVNLYGIESPGLTSALAIAENVADTLK